LCSLGLVAADGLAGGADSDFDVSASLEESADFLGAASVERPDAAGASAAGPGESEDGAEELGEESLGWVGCNGAEFEPLGPEPTGAALAGAAASLFADGGEVLSENFSGAVGVDAVPESGF